MQMRVAANQCAMSCEGPPITCGPGQAAKPGALVGAHTRSTQGCGNPSPTAVVRIQLARVWLTTVTRWGRRETNSFPLPRWRATSEGNMVYERCCVSPQSWLRELTLLKPSVDSINSKACFRVEDMDRLWGDPREHHFVRGWRNGGRGRYHTIRFGEPAVEEATGAEFLDHLDIERQGVVPARMGDLDVLRSDSQYD